jgi:hypothetical protein
MKFKNISLVKIILIVSFGVLLFFCLVLYSRMFIIQELRTKRILTPKIEIYDGDTTYIYRDYYR